jgi:hypothetical protein
MPARIIPMVSAAPPDPRRTIIEAVLPTEADFGIARFTRLDIHPAPGEGPAVLGRHYHCNDRERFVLIAGHGVLVSQEVNSATKQLTGKSRFHAIKAGDVIVMEPYTAHTFIFDVPATMVCASTRSFDRHDMPAAEPELPSLGYRTMVGLSAETTTAEAGRAEEIYYTTHSGAQVEFLTDPVTVIIDHEHIKITEENLGAVLLRVRAA